MFLIQIDEVIAKICSLETRVDPRESSETINEIRRAAIQTTHM